MPRKSASSNSPVDAYLAAVTNPEAQKTLSALRTQLRKLLDGFPSDLT